MELDHGATLQSALDPDQWGLRIGFVGGTDRHDTHPGSVCQTDTVMAQHPYGGGLTIVVLDENEELDRGPIHGALTERRTYATSGPLVPAVVEYWIGETYLGGMGEEFVVDEGDGLEVRLRVPTIWDPFVIEASLVSPEGSRQMAPAETGTFVATVPPDEVPVYAYPLVRIDGEAWYGDDGCDDSGEDGEERLWLSPTWFAEAAGDDDDDDDDDTGDDDDTAGDDDTFGDDDSAGDDDASGDDDTAGDDDDGTGDGWLSEPDEIGTCRCSATPTRPGPGAPLAAAAVLVALRRRGRGDQSTGSRSARQVA